MAAVDVVIIFFSVVIPATVSYIGLYICMLCINRLISKRPTRNDTSQLINDPGNPNNTIHTNQNTHVHSRGDTSNASVNEFENPLHNMAPGHQMPSTSSGSQANVNGSSNTGYNHATHFSGDAGPPKYELEVASNGFM